MEHRQRVVMTLDLQDDAALQAEYRRHHEQVPATIEASLREAGILEMEIYTLGNRLVMIMEVAADFSFARKAELDAANADVQAWEQLMWRFQSPLEGSAAGEKWMPMEKIYSLTSSPGR